MKTKIDTSELLGARESAELAGIPLPTFYAYDRDRARGCPSYAVRDERTGRKKWRRADIEKWAVDLHAQPGRTSAHRAAALHNAIRDMYDEKLNAAIEAAAMAIGVSASLAARWYNRGESFKAPKQEGRRQALVARVESATQYLPMQVAQALDLHIRTVHRHLALKGETCNCA